MSQRASSAVPGTDEGHRSTRRAARNVVAVVAGELVGKGATLVFTVVVARGLGITGFGSFSYALAFGMLLATLIGWGFDAEQIRRAGADLAELDAAFAQALVLRTVHAVPVVLLGAVIGVLTRPSAGASWTLVLVLLASVSDSYGDAGRAAATSLEQLGRTVVALVAQRVSACGLAVLVLAAGGGLVEVAGVYLLSSLLGVATLAVLLRGLGIRPKWSAVDAAALRAMWRRTFLIGVDAVLSMALFRVDALMLGALSGDRAVAAYSVAYRLMETVLFVNWAVSRSLFPAMVRAARGPALLRIGAGAISIAGALLVPYGVLVALDGPALLRLLFGSGYGRESAVALQLLAFAPVAFAVSYLGSYLLIVQQRASRLVLSTLLGVGVNAGLNIALIPTYGARGAAFATTISYTVQAVVTVAMIVKENGLLRVDLALALPVASTIPMAVVLVVLHQPVLVEAVASTSVYLIAYLLLARWRDPNQLKLLSSVLGRS